MRIAYPTVITETEEELAAAERRLRVWLRRRWCPRGTRPPWVVDDRDAWWWRSTAVEPATGAGCFLLLPGVSKEWLQVFPDKVAPAVGDQRVGLVRDGSGSHRATLAWPPGVTPLPLPPSSPELNPAEQIFRSLRAKLANHVFADLAELEAAITERLRVLGPAGDTTAADGLPVVDPVSREHDDISLVKPYEDGRQPLPFDCHSV